MFQSWLRFLPILVLTLLAPGWTPAQETAPATAGTAEAELREAIRACRGTRGPRTCAAGGRPWTRLPTHHRRK
jgi:hypothetical protein